MNLEKRREEVIAFMRPFVESRTPTQLKEMRVPQIIDRLANSALEQLGPLLRDLDLLNKNIDNLNY
jgi:hypothetical protein